MLAYNPCAVSNGRPPPKSSTGMASATTTLSLKSEKKALKSVISHADEVCDSRVGRLKTSSSFLEKVKHLFPGVTIKSENKNDRIQNDISKSETSLRTTSFCVKNGDISRSSVASLDSLCSYRTADNPVKCSTPRGSQRDFSQPRNNDLVDDFSCSSSLGNPRKDKNQPIEPKKGQKLRKWRFRRRSSLDENIISTPGKFPCDNIYQESDFKDIEEIKCYNTPGKQIVIPFLTPDNREDIIMTDETIVVSPDAHGESSKLSHTAFFNRGSSLFSSMRSSLRKISYRTHKKDNVIDLEPLLSPPPIEVISTTLQEINASLNLKLEDMKSNDSQDSGLGEDSDLGEASVVTSPRTPPPCTIPVGSSIAPTPILRLATCSSVGSSKKHVVILEPNKTDLPSAKRQLYRQSMPPRLETVRIRAPILPEDTNLVTETNAFSGDVSAQWNQLCESAKEESERVIKSLVIFSCDTTCPFRPEAAIGYIFQTQNLSIMQRSLEILDSDSVCLVIYTVYRLLFYDWISHSNRMVVSVLVHCVQRFLVVVVQVCRDLDGISRLKLLKNFQQLLSSSEENRYTDLRTCLYSTRTLYIDLWCSLLEVKKTLSHCSEQWI